jgi:hypothetical protein
MCGIDQRRQKRTPGLIDDQLRGFYHRLEPQRPGRESESRLELLERIDERRHLIDGGNLWQGDEEPVGEPTGVPNERREKDVECPQTACVQLGGHGLDTEPDERRQRIILQSAGDRTRAGLGVIILLGVWADAIAVFVVDPEILDRFALQLVADALVHCLGEPEVAVVAQGHTDRLGQRVGVGRVLVHRTQGELTELWDGIGGEELGAAIHGMNWLPSTRFSRVAAGEVSVDGLQPRHDRREIRGRQ